jgi:hypothetical protein
MSRDPKQTGVVGETATGFGGEAKGGGPAGSGGADGECHGTAEAGETKVLNEKFVKPEATPG